MRFDVHLPFQDECRESMTELIKRGGRASRICDVHVNSRKDECHKLDWSTKQIQDRRLTLEHFYTRKG